MTNSWRKRRQISGAAEHLSTSKLLEDKQIGFMTERD